jgi:hypothetical protein
MAPINEHLLNLIFWWECCLIHFQAFCWIVNYVVYNEEARECEGRYPWDYAAEGVDGQMPLPPIIDLRHDRRVWPCFITSKSRGVGHVCLALLFLVLYSM